MTSSVPAQRATNAPQPADGSMVATARRNLSAFLSKASFATSVDRRAALDCLEVLCTALDASPQPSAKALTDERALDLYDEIECDLRGLFARASKEGHDFGQGLAGQVRAKMQRARALLAAEQPSNTAAPKPYYGLEVWRRARFGAFHEGKFVELESDDIDHPAAGRARWVGGSHDYELLSHIFIDLAADRVSLPSEDKREVQS
ncbi:MULTISPECIES: hypothetical protein [Cupriavidus]